MAKDPKELPSEENSHEQNVKISVESILGSKAKLRRVKKSPEDIKVETFCQVIAALEHVETREFLLQEDFQLDLTKYNDSYHTVIEGLLQMLFSQTQLNFIDFYLYKRIDEEGQIVPLELSTGKLLYLNNPVELYSLLKEIP